VLEEVFMRIVVAVGAYASKVEDIDKCMRYVYLYKNGFAEIVTGGYEQRNKVVLEWANSFNCVTTLFGDKESDGNKSAQEVRNEQMAEYGDMLVAIWDGKSVGTRDMIECMKELRKPYFVFWT
jgi:hypothetical protein